MLRATPRATQIWTSCSSRSTRPIAEIWRYLIATPASEIRRIPLVEHVDELPSSLAEGARYLVRFTLAVMQARPCNQLSNAFRKQSVAHPTWIRGWDQGQRDRVASQVERIRHWKLIEGDYTCAPRLRATYFVDPPYNNKAGMKYPCGPKQLDYGDLAGWCRELPGQVIVCEQEGADWLPFARFGQFVRGLNKVEGSREVVWTADDALG